MGGRTIAQWINHRRDLPVTVVAEVVTVAFCIDHRRTILACIPRQGRTIAIVVFYRANLTIGTVAELQRADHRSFDRRQGPRTVKKTLIGQGCSIALGVDHTTDPRIATAIPEIGGPRP